MGTSQRHDGHGAAVRGYRGPANLLLIPSLAALTLAGPLGAAEIHDAVRTNDVLRVDALLDAHPDEARNAVLGDGITPLHLAAAMDLDVAAGILLFRGADVSARTSGGFTPLHWAASRDSVRVAKLLIAAGADVNAKTLTGITPLHWAAAKNSAGVARLLIVCGANFSEKTVTGLTPLQWAVKNRASDVYTLLAYKIVSDEMALEVHPPEPGLTQGAVTQAVTTVALEGAEASEPEEEEELAPLPPPVIRKPVLGRRLAVDIGFNQTLELVWIDSLTLWAGKYEVTNGQFRRHRPGHDSGSREGISLNGDAQPAVQLSWEDAQKYIAWLNKNFAGSLPGRCRFRLPTEAEWVVMARCGDKREYPWGDQWPPAYGNFSDLAARRSLIDWTGIRGYDDGYAVTCPVTASGENEWGLYGMGGNAWEWCEDWFNTSKKYRVRKGGGWDFDQQPNLRVDARGFDRPAARYDTVGFRLVISQGG